MAVLSPCGTLVSREKPPAAPAVSSGSRSGNGASPVSTDSGPGLRRREQENGPPPRGLWCSVWGPVGLAAPVHVDLPLALRNRGRLAAP